MPAFILGRLSFEKLRRDSTESAEQVIAIHDCAPPPRGSRLNGNPAAQWPAEIQPTFLQPSEIGRIVAGAAAPPGPSDFGSILAAVMANLGLKPLPIDTSLVPAGWHRVTPCARTTIACVVESDIIDVDVTTTVDATFGGETYPAGDRIASFRVLNPRRYRFVRRPEANPACCQDFHAILPVEQSDWFPESERDFSIFIGPGIDWDYKWKFTPKLKYDLYQPEGLPQPDTQERLRQELEEQRRQLRELEEKLRKLIEGSGN